MDYKEAILYYDAKTGLYKRVMDGFCKFSPAYTISNEFLNAAMGTLKPQGKSVLTVAGSGDQPFFYKIYGASHVDTFDISYCAKVVMDVKTAAVQNLNHNEYKKFLDSIGTASVHIPDVQNYDRISSGLSQDVKDFMNLMKGLKYRLNSGYNFNMPTSEQYQKLQSSINKPCDFIWSDVMSLSGHLTRKYDQMYLSNIFQYNCDTDKTIKLVKDLLPSLNDGGEIMLYVTPWLKDEELNVLKQVEKSLQKFIKIGCAKDSTQQIIIVKKL